MFRLRLFSLFCAVTIVLAGGLILPGCGEQQPPWYDGIYDLSNVRVSEDLAPTLDLAIASLNDPLPRGKSVDDLAKYEDLIIRLKSPTGSTAAGDEVYRLWEQEPENFLWIELAKNNNRHLRRSDDLQRMCALPALSDTATAVGAYVEGRLRFRQTDRGQMYRNAEARIAELDTLQQVWLNIKLASVDFGSGDAVGAVRRLLGLLPTVRAVGGPNMETTLWKNIARKLTTMDRLDDALQAAVMSEAKARQAGNRYRVLRAKESIADIMNARQEYGGALEQAYQSIETAESEGFTWLIQTGLKQAAGLCTELGDYEQALVLDRRNLALTIARDDPLNMPRALSTVAHDHRMLGDLDSCHVYLMRASEYVDETSDRRNRSKMATLLAEYHCLVGEYEVADSLLVAARGLSATSGTEHHEARLLLELIPAAIEMGRADRAYTWLARVESLQETLHDEAFDQNLRADFEMLTTRLLAYQGEYGRAAEALRRAGQEVATGGGEGKLLDLKFLTGELAQLREDLVSAREAFTECLALAEDGGTAEEISRCRFRLGYVLLEEGRFSQARALFTGSGEEEDFGPRFRTRLSALLWLGMSWAKEDRHDVALERFEQALGLCTRHSPPDLVARLKIEQGRSLTALGRAAEAEGILWALHGSLKGGTEHSAVEELQMFQSTALRDAAEILIGLYVDHPKLADDEPVGSLTRNLAWPCVNEDGRSAPTASGDLQLMFFVGADRSFAWVTDSNECLVHELPGREALRRSLVPVLADMTTPGRPVDKSAAAVVATALLGPAADSWQPGQTLSILADGLLQDVPWSGLSLPTAFGSSAGRTALEFGPLVEYRSEGYQASASGALATNALSLLAVGCDEAGAKSASGASALRGLRRAEQEARRIEAFWPGSDNALLLGSEAGWRQVTALDLQQFGVIHLATHAVVYPGRSHQSTLRLAAAEGAEPVTIQSVAGLNLNAELVFLSCCNAARRLSATGDGASDFAGAFLTAGARTVIASTLWVDDEASAYLSEAFYRNWLAGMTRAEALRASLLEMREARDEWNHPAYWAFHRLIGDPG